MLRTTSNGVWGDYLSSESKSLSIEQSILWNSLGSMVYLVCNWLTTVLVVVFGSDLSMSGSLAVAMSVGNIYATIVLFRARTVQVSETQRNISSGDFVGHRIITVIIATIFCFAYSIFSVASSDWIVVSAYCLFKAVDSFVDVLHGVDQIYSRLDYAAVSQILRGIGLLAGFIFGLVFFKSLLMAVLFMAIVSLAVVVMYDIRVVSRLCSVSPCFNKDSLIHLFKVCFPGFIASLACTSVVSLTRQFYGLSYGNEQLGIYAAVATPTAVVQALVTYLYAPLLGPLAKGWQEGRIKDIVRLIRKVLLAVTAATVVCVVGALVLGEPVLTLIYGQVVGAHSQYLLLMLVATAFTGLMFFLIDLTISFGKPSYGFVSSIAALLSAVFLSRQLFSRQEFTMDANVISVVVISAYGIGLVILGILIIGLIKSKALSQQDESVG